MEVGGGLRHDRQFLFVQVSTIEAAKVLLLEAGETKAGESTQDVIHVNIANILGL